MGQADAVPHKFWLQRLGPIISIGLGGGAHVHGAGDCAITLNWSSFRHADSEEEELPREARMDVFVCQLYIRARVLRWYTADIEFAIAVGALVMSSRRSRHISNKPRCTFRKDHPGR